LVFPCNQFGGQEPGDEGQIAGFCQRNFGVTFLMAEKVEVNGEGAHPLFAFLTAALPGVLGSHAIKWNFTKFLIDKAGVPVKRYAPMTPPGDLGRDIEALL
jgi:glutathione peroxidase